MDARTDVSRAVQERLIQAARAGQFVFYGELADELGLDLSVLANRVELEAVLDLISRREVAEGRPMLSAICVQPQDHLPGSGFLILGEELGLTEPNDDETTFGIRQIKAVHGTWSELPPFGEGQEALP
jgi:hypothetical protein